MAQSKTDDIQSPQGESVDVAKDSAVDLTLSNYVGVLREDPDDVELQATVLKFVENGPMERLGEQPGRLLELARKLHEQRGDWSAVATLLRAEIALVRDDAKLHRQRLMDLANVHGEFLLDDERAKAVYEEVLALGADREAEEALKRMEQTGEKWKQISKRFVEEADATSDLALQTSLLLRAAALVWKNHKKKGRNKEVDSLLQAVLKLDPGHIKAAALLHVTLSEREEWSKLAESLLAIADAAKEERAKAGLYLRVARICARKLQDKSRAVACYERVLDLEPADKEAIDFLAKYFTDYAQWDHLAGLYEDALRARQKLGVEHDLLVQVSMVHWKMRKRLDAAEPFVARLRRLSPAHSVVLDFYREFYTESSQVEALLAVLADAQRATTEADQRLSLAVELARAMHAHPGLHDRATEAWKLVLRIDPSNEEAAEVIKELYAKTGKWNALVEVLRTECDSILDSEVERKVSLLRRLAEIYRVHLRMDGMAVNTYNAILKLLPDDRRTLDELAERYRAMERYNDLIAVLAKEAETRQDVDERVELYLEIAALWIEQLSNLSQATMALERVLELRPDNTVALVRLKEIYEKKRAWGPLFEVLRREREVTTSRHVRVENAMLMAKLLSERLHRHQEAISLWLEVIADDSGKVEAFDSAEKLTEREQDWSRLAVVLEQRLRVTEDADQRLRLLQKLGGLYAEPLNDVERAKAAYKEMLVIDQRHGRALRSLRDLIVAGGDFQELESVYRTIGDWDGLVEVLGSEADRSEDPARKVALSFQAARVFREELADPLRSLRSYERVLTVEPHHLVALRAVLPIYERQEKWSRYVAVAESLLSVMGEGEIGERLALFKRLVSVSDERMRDGENAFEYAKRAYQLAPRDAEAHQMLENATLRAAAFDRLRAVYLDAVGSLPQQDALALHRRIAHISAERLGDFSTAATHYRMVLAALPEDEECLLALERAERASQNPVGIIDALSRRLQRESDGELRFQFLGELAQLKEGIQQDTEAAAECYRQMADIDGANAEVLAHLDRLAVMAERHQEVAEVLQRRLSLDLEPSERVQLGARLGQLLLQPLGRPGEAFAVLSQVLEIEPSHAAALAALERMADDGVIAKRPVLDVLEASYERTARYDKLARILEARLAEEEDVEETRNLRLRIAEISTSKLGDSAAAYGALEAAFLADPSDESLWDKLAEAAKQAQQQAALAHAYRMAVELQGLDGDAVAELSRRAARLYDGVLGQPEEAALFHRKVLAVQPLDELAFVALKKLWTDRERWDDLQALYRVRIEETVDVPDKVELLLQTCFLHLEILDKPELAIEAYRHVLELEPEHAASIRALEKLLERTERYRELAEHLAAYLDRAQGPDLVDHLYRLGQLYEMKLGDPVQAVDQYEAIVQQQPTHLRAQEALARLLLVEATRNRAATILEPIYEAQGAYKDLCGVLQIQLETSDFSADERMERTLQLGELLETRLREPAAAIAVFARACEADPADERPRKALARIAEASEEFSKQRAAVLSTLIERATDNRDLTGTLLLELAALLDEFLDDQEGAERTYSRLIELDETDAERVLLAARALEQIHLRSENHRGLAQDLERQLSFESGPEQRSALLSRLATLYQDVLSVPGRAIEVNQERLELEPSDRDAAERLSTLLREAGRWPELVEALRARAQWAPDAELQRGLSIEACRIIEEQLDDATGAIDGYNEVLAVHGPRLEVLKALTALYERTERYSDLVDVLEQQEPLTSGQEQLVALRHRVAEVMRLRLGDEAGSLAKYELVLELDANHAPTLNALETLMTSKDPTVQSDAARLAIPRYEAAAALEKLISALLVLSHMDDPATSIGSLRRAADVADNRLHQPGQAFDYVAQAVFIDSGDPELSTMLDDLRRLAETSGRYRDLVGVLQRLAPEILDGDLKVETYRQMALVARDKLVDAPLARQAFELLLEQQPEDSGALIALEKLLDEAGDYPALIDVLRRRIEIEADGAIRAALMMRKADLHERSGDADSAISVLEDLVLESPQPRVYEALQRLYEEVGRYENLVGVYERQLEAQMGDPVQLRYLAGKACQERLDDTSRALTFLRDAVTDDPNHAPSVEMLETLMVVPGEFRPVIAQVLEPIYLNRMEWEKLSGALEAQLESETDVDERKRLLVRLSQLFEDQLEDFAGTFAVYARLFREDPRDEHVWERLTRLAKVAERWAELASVFVGAFGDGPLEDDIMANLAKYTGQIYDERVSDLPRAAGMYRRALEFDERDSTAFAALESIYVRLPDYEALAGLYRSQADVADTDELRIKLLHKRAVVVRGPMKQAVDAIEAYRELLQLDPGDRVAADALTALLEERRDYQALADHMRFRAEQTAGTAEAAVFKLRLAQILRSSLSDLNGALDVLEDIFVDSPGYAGAVAMLEELVQGEPLRLRITEILEPVYRQLDQWMKLVAILEAQVELRDDREEQVRLLQEVAALHLNRGQNGGLAFDAMGRALVIDPDSESLRQEVNGLALALGCWDVLAAVYEAALNNATDSITRISLLSALGKVHDEQRGDPRSAIAVYERLSIEDAEEQLVLDKLVALYTMIGDWNGLVATLERKVAQSLDVGERCELLRRIASVYEELLGDADTAIGVYRRATQEDDADLLSYEALDRLYTSRAASVPLVDVLRRRLELVTDPELRVEIGLRLAALLQHQLRRPEEAIEAYRGVLDDDSDNAVAVGELAALFESHSMWPELIDNLSLQIAQATSSHQRVAQHYRMAHLYRVRMKEREEAIEHYRLALSEDPRHEPSIAALLELAQQAAVREQVKEILVPLLRKQGRFDDLVQLAEWTLEGQQDAFDRREQLVSIAKLHEDDRRDRAAAFDAYCRAASEDPTFVVVQDELERLAASEGLFSRLAPVFDQRASEIEDSTEAAALYSRAARIFEQELKNDGAAIAAYGRASERDPENDTVLEHLDSLYVRSGAWEELLKILERRATVVVDVASRSQLLNRLGELRETRFGHHRAAFGAYSEVLELVAGDGQALAGLERLCEQPEVATEAVEVLDNAYRQIGAMDKVIALYDVRARMAGTSEERIQVLRDAAAIWERDLKDPSRAIATLGKVLAADPGSDDSLMEVERIASENGLWPSMRGFIEQVLASVQLLRERERELCMHAARWYREFLGDAAAEEAMLRRVLATVPDDDEAHRSLLNLLRVPGRERDLVIALRAAGSVEKDTVSRRELFKEASELAERKLTNPTVAAECLDEVMIADPEDVDSLDELIRLRTALGHTEALAPLLSRRVELSMDDSTRLPLLHRLGSLYADALGDSEKAIGAYKEILDREPSDADAANALERLYGRVQRYAELSELLNHRLNQATTQDERTDVRVRMASLQERHFGDTDGAVEQLRAILSEDPSHAGAFAELERLYAGAKRYPELALLLSRRIEQADATDGRATEIECLRKLCKLYGGDLGDLQNAISGYERLAFLVPQDVEALSALVRLYADVSRFADMADVLDRLIPLLPPDEAIEAAVTLEELCSQALGDRERAIGALQTALALDPRRENVRAKLRERYEEGGHYELLVQALSEDEAESSDPQVKLSLLKRLASVYAQRLKQPAGAIPLLERAVALAPEDRDVLLMLCDIYIAANRSADAVPVLEKIIASYGGRRAKEVAVYHHRLGKALEGLGQLDGAFEHYDAAFKIDLTNVPILRDLGRVCMQRGDLDRALKTYRALLLQRLGPDDEISKADVYYWLGEIMSKQGDTLRAKSMLERAITEGGGHAEASALLATLS